jgi:hypothetical protein
VRGAPTARAGCEIEPHGSFLSLVCPMHPGSPQRWCWTMAAPGVSHWCQPEPRHGRRPPAGAQLGHCEIT